MALDNKSQVNVLHGPFDSLSYEILLPKLAKIGWSTEIGNVPQESNLGLLFNINLNCLLLFAVNCQYHEYADDVIIYSSNNIKILQNNLDFPFQ